MAAVKLHTYMKVIIPIMIFSVIFVALQFKLYPINIETYTMTLLYKFEMKPKSFVENMALHYKHVSWKKFGGMKFIILAMTDNSFTDVALNLYLSSFKRFEIRNFLFVGGGKNACQNLNRLKIQCFDFWEDPDSNRSHNYGSKEFIRKMNIRTEMILAALRAGYSVLHTDLDVVFMKNPMAEIEELLSKNDMAILWDHRSHNAGFLAVKATPFSMDVYTTMQNLTNSSDRLDDQKALNRALKSVMEQYTMSNNSYAITSLDKNRYLCGKDYFERNRHFPAVAPKDNCPNCTVVHNNWIYGKAAKIYRFKEATMWRVDESGYYSDERRKYLLVYNPPPHDPPAGLSIKEQETKALRSSLKMAAILNRTLILPRFHCHAKMECPLISWFRIESFHRKFSPHYRESSFLLNDLVLESISMKSRAGCLPDNSTYIPSKKSPTSCNKQDIGSRSKCISFNPVPILILTKNNSNASFYSVSAAMAAYPESEIWNLSSHGWLGELTVMDKFGKCSDQVLVLASLFDIEVRFSNVKKEELFKEKLDKGIVGSSYLQA